MSVTVISPSPLTYFARERNLSAEQLEQIVMKSDPDAQVLDVIDLDASTGVSRRADQVTISSGGAC